MRMDDFIKQHAEIMELATSIKHHIDVGVTEHIDTIHAELIKLSAKIKFHLAIEDTQLYPMLLKSNKIEVVNLGRRYQDEMGDLSSIFNDYIKKWFTKSSILADVANFVDETKAVFGALKKRIQAENTELYKLAALI